MGVTRRVMVVDGNNLLIRAVKAMERSTSHLSVDDVPTGPLLLFINQLSRHVQAVNPDRLVVCWDGGRSQYRMSVYEDYKSQRRARDPDSPEGYSFALSKEFLTLAGLHHVIIEGVEADDLVAHYWREKTNDQRVFILSGDKDFLQLLDGWTEQIRPGSDENWTANRVRTEMGCKPEHLPLVMALTGDAGDGVPGIPGFGLKTACKALAAHEWDLERLLASDDRRWVRKLDGTMPEAVRRNLLLVDLRSTPPFDVHIDLPEAPQFAPTTQASVLWSELSGFLDRWRMATVKDRLIAGTLWSSTSATQQQDRLDFSGVTDG